MNTGYTRGNSLIRKSSKRKTKPKNNHKQKIMPKSAKKTTPQTDLTSENIIRLKLTTRKETRIESVPLNKMKHLAIKKTLCWKLEHNWLFLIGSS